MIEGSCLCGAVRYRAVETAGPMANCHCRMCRKAHGAAFSSILPVRRAGFRWLAGEEGLARFESSPGKRRWFCSTCGSHLISTRDADQRSLLVRAGTIDCGYEAPPRGARLGRIQGAMALYHRRAAAFRPRFSGRAAG